MFMHAPAAKLAQLGLLVLLALVLVPLTGVTVSTLHAGQPAEIAFNIPAQSLASALTEVGAQAKVQVLFDEAVVRGLKAPALKSRSTAQTALNQLLRDTGLTAVSSGPGTFTIQRVKQSSAKEPQPAEAPIVLPQVTVQDNRDQGYVATQSSVGTKTDTPLIETPQSISIVTAEQIRDQGAQTISQALRYTAGVFVEPQGASSNYDETRVRGFLPIQYLDGMQVPLNRFFATPRIEPYGLERLEVLKGPASGLYGQNSPGGLLNTVSKRPNLEPLREIFFGGGSFDRIQSGADLGGPIDQDGKFLYRLTTIGQDADTIVDFTKDQRFFVAPAFSWRPTANTSFTLLCNYGLDRGNYPHQYLPAQGTRFSNPNGRIPRRRFAGEPGFDKFDRDQFSVGAALEHRFSETWSVRQNLRYAGVDAFFRAFRSEGLEGDLRTLNRSAFSQDVDAKTLTVDNQAQTNFSTGPLRHKLLVGLDYLRTAGDYDVRFAFPATSIDIFNPVYGQAIPALSPFMNTRDTQNQLGLYAQDQIKFDRWVLTLGGRHDWAKGKTVDRLASTTTQQDDNAFTGRAGLNYLFDNGVAPYFSYATSFQPTAGLDSSGRSFKPSKGRQYEVGVKYQPAGTQSMITFAAFDLKRRNVVTFDAITFEGRQTGEVHVKGIELEGKTNLSESIEMIASYAFSHSKITQSANSFELGRQAPLTPKHQASGWAYYTFREGMFTGLGLGAGVRYVGANFSETETADPVRVPAYTLFDAALRYDLGALTSALRGAQASFNATNLADKYHVTYCYTLAYCSLGAGRVLQGNLSYRW